MSVPSIWRAVAGSLAALLLGAIVAWAQNPSLAEVARKEEERRKTTKPATRVLTNKDLPTVSTPAPDAQAHPTPAPEPSQPEATAEKPDQADKANDAADKVEKPKDEAWWRARISEPREQLHRDEVLLDALQTRINGLTTDFAARDDPDQRARIGEDRQKAIAELERVKTDIVDQQEGDRRHRRRGAQGRRPARLAPLTSVPRDRTRPDPPRRRQGLAAHDAAARARAQGHTVIEARDQPEAVRLLQQNQPAVVLSDLRLPEGDGFGVLRAAKEIDPELPVIVMTAYGSIQDAVAAMKEGALDFLAKPVDPDHLLLLVERALAQRRMVTENLLLKEELAARRGAPQIVGEDPSLKQVSRRCSARRRPTRRCCSKARAAPARSCSRGRCTRSARAPTAPFVAINCAAIPENAARDRAVRPREGRVHRRGRAQAGQVRDGAPRHAVPRRDRRAAAVAAGEDPARARGEAVRARRRHGARCRSTCGSSPRPTGTCARRSRRGSSARISTSGCRCFRSPFRRCASGPDDIPLLARYFIERFCRDLKKKPLALSPARDRGAAGLPLAGQRARAAELHRARGDPRRRRHDPAAASEPVVRRAAGAGAAPIPWAQIDLSGTLADATRRVVVRGRAAEDREGAAARPDGNKGRAAELLQISYKMLLAKLKEYGLE